MLSPNSSTAGAELLTHAREAHEARLRAYVGRILHDEAWARDVVQETFLALARQPEEPDLRPRLRAWLFTVSRRKALNVLRAEGRNSSLESPDLLVSPEPSPAEQLQVGEDHRHLLGLVGKLPLGQREVLRLRYQENFSYQEIAVITERSAGHVGVLLHHALQTLRREWHVTAHR